MRSGERDKLHECGAGDASDGKFSATTYNLYDKCDGCGAKSYSLECFDLIISSILKKGFDHDKIDDPEGVWARPHGSRRRPS